MKVVRCLLIALCTIGIAFAVSSPELCNNVCTTEKCVDAAATVLRHMNATVDPCEDFYEYSCGRFLKEEVIPDDTFTRSLGVQMRKEDLVRQGKILLEEESGPGEWELITRAKTFYRSCMDDEVIEERGVEPLREVYEELGGWPVLDEDWSEKDFSFSEYSIALSKKGLIDDAIVKVDIAPDDEDRSTRSIYLDQPSLGEKKRLLLKGADSDIMQGYYQLMWKMAVLLGAREDQARKDMRDVLEFEIALAEAFSGKKSDSESYELSDFPSLPGHPKSWHEFVNEKLFSIDIAPEDKVIVKDPEYFNKLSDLLSNAPPRTVSNYLGWRVALSMVRHLNKEVKDTVKQYWQVKYGIDSNSPKWKFCASITGFYPRVMASFRIPATVMYVKRFFTPEARERAIEVVDYVKQSFRSILENAEWMDSETRQNAFEKLDSISQAIGYVDEILDKELQTEHHEGIEIREDGFFGNNLRLNIWYRKNQQSQYREEVDNADWRNNILGSHVQSEYNQLDNALRVSAGLLQPIMYQYGRPSYLNFGAAGALVGRLIAGGFDDKGRQFDAEGNSENWWSEETEENYNSRLQCIADQYQNFNVVQVDLNLDGEASKRSNIEDHGGIKAAYEAYERSLQDNEEEQENMLLPALDLTPKQLFWVSYAQMQCTKYKDTHLRNLVEGGRVPDRFRVVGPLQNNEDFARDFQCPEGTFMNPREKCTVW